MSIGYRSIRFTTLDQAMAWFVEIYEDRIRDLHSDLLVDEIDVEVIDALIAKARDGFPEAAAMFRQELVFLVEDAQTNDEARTVVER
jgi:hypothetical protein